MPKVNTGQDPFIEPAKREHLFQRAKLVDLAHCFRTHMDVGKPFPVECRYAFSGGVNRQLKRLLPTDFSTGAGMDNHPVTPQCVNRLR